MAQPNGVLPTYSQVEVCHLITQDRPFNGSQDVRRPPRVGDIGMVVSITQHRWDGDLVYIVKKLAEDGRTIWLADFTPDELALVEGR